MPRGGARAGAGRRKGHTGRTFESPEQIQRFRARIQTNQIIKHLNQIAAGELDDPKSPVVTAGLGLLKKVLPDLATVEHTGKDGGAIEHSVGLAWMTEAEAKNRGWA